MMLSQAGTSTLQWALALLVFVASATLAIFKWRSDWGKPFSLAPRAGYPDEETFSARISTLPAGNDAPSAFADRAKALNGSYLDSMKALDDKAAAMLAFVGSGSALLALAAGAEKVMRPAITPLLVLGALYLFGVLAFAIAVQLPRNRGSVNVERLCDLDLLSRSSGKSRMDAIIGREYVEASRIAVAVVRKKANFLAATQICFAFGIATIVLNTLTLPAANLAEAASSWNCTIKADALECRIGVPLTKVDSARRGSASIGQAKR